MNESRMKIYEQLELSMIDLEKGNTRLKEEAHVDKERVRGLTATVATLELRTPVDFHSYPHIRPACLPQVRTSDANVVIASSRCVRIRVPQF